MATGDIALKVTGTYISDDESTRISSQAQQTTTLAGGTTVTAPTGTTFGSATVKASRDATSGPVGETAFDGSKRYTIAITEE